MYLPLGAQVKTQKSPMHARDKHAWGVVDVLFCGLLCCLACGLHRQIEVCGSNVSAL
jgi:hypothetical protein